MLTIVRRVRTSRSRTWRSRISWVALERGASVDSSCCRRPRAVAIRIVLRELPRRTSCTRRRGLGRGGYCGRDVWAEVAARTGLLRRLRCGQRVDEVFLSLEQRSGLGLPSDGSVTHPIFVAWFHDARVVGADGSGCIFTNSDDEGNDEIVEKQEEASEGEYR
jgi:hypothetical protein